MSRSGYAGATCPYESGRNIRSVVVVRCGQEISKNTAGASEKEKLFKFWCPNPECDWKVEYNATRLIKRECPYCGRKFTKEELVPVKVYQVTSRIDRARKS